MSNQVKIIRECNEMLGCVNNLSNYLDKLNEYADLNDPYSLVIDIIRSMYDYDSEILMDILYNGVEKKLAITKENLSNKLPYLQQALEVK